MTTSVYFYQGLSRDMELDVEDGLSDEGIVRRASTTSIPINELLDHYAELITRVLDAGLVNPVEHIRLMADRDACQGWFLVDDECDVQ